MSTGDEECFRQDASRRRRTQDPARQKFYAVSRTIRWRRHYFGVEVKDLAVEVLMVLQTGGK